MPRTTKVSKPTAAVQEDVHSQPSKLRTTAAREFNEDMNTDPTRKGQADVPDMWDISKRLPHGQATRILPEDMPSFRHPDIDMKWSMNNFREMQDRALANRKEPAETATSPSLLKYPHDLASTVTPEMRESAAKAKKWMEELDSTTQFKTFDKPSYKSEPTGMFTVTGPVLPGIKSMKYTTRPERRFERMNQNDVQDSKERQLRHHGLAEIKKGGGRWDLFPVGTKFDEEDQPIFTGSQKKAAVLIQSYQYESSDSEKEDIFSSSRIDKMRAKPKKKGNFRAFKAAMKQLLKDDNPSAPPAAGDTIESPRASLTHPVRRSTRPVKQVASSAGFGTQGLAAQTVQSTKEQRDGISGADKTAEKAHPLSEATHAESKLAEVTKKAISPKTKRSASATLLDSEPEETPPQKRARRTVENNDPSVANLTSSDLITLIAEQVGKTIAPVSKKRGAAAAFDGSEEQESTIRKKARKTSSSANFLSSNTNKCEVGSESNFSAIMTTAAAVESRLPASSSPENVTPGDNGAFQLGSPTKRINLLPPRPPVRIKLSTRKTWLDGSMLPKLVPIQMAAKDESLTEDMGKKARLRSLRLRLDPPATLPSDADPTSSGPRSSTTDEATQSGQADKPKSKGAQKPTSAQGQLETTAKGSKQRKIAPRETSATPKIVRMAATGSSAIDGMARSDVSKKQPTKVQAAQGLRAVEVRKLPRPKLKNTANPDALQDAEQASTPVPFAGR